MGLFEGIKSFIARVWVWAVLVASGRKAQFFSDVRGASTIKIIVSLFLVGSLLPSAIVLVSNQTAYSGADSNVALICYMVVPMLGSLAIGLSYLKYTGRI